VNYSLSKLLKGLALRELLEFELHTQPIQLLPVTESFINKS